MARTRSMNAALKVDRAGAKKTQLTEWLREGTSRHFVKSETASTGAVELQSVQTTKRSSITRVTKRPSRSTSHTTSKARTGSKYAHPSKYAHLPGLQDVLEPNLICVFVGFNPGIRTATAGHAYAHPSNLFWKLLHSSGCTDRRCRPEEDGGLPRLFGMGNTNIVERPSKDIAELAKGEMAAGTAKLEAKIRKFKPEAVCIVGKGIWENIWVYRYGRRPSPSEFRYGWQEERYNMGKGTHGEVDFNGQPWRGARVFVATSTSGLSASPSQKEKEEIWKPFGDWVKSRRAERSIERQSI